MHEIERLTLALVVAAAAGITPPSTRLRALGRRGCRCHRRSIRCLARVGGSQSFIMDHPYWAPRFSRDEVAAVFAALGVWLTSVVGRYAGRHVATPKAVAAARDKGTAAAAAVRG
jgi:hypothetical protein